MIQLGRTFNIVHHLNTPANRSLSQYDELNAFPSFRERAKLLYLWDMMGSCNADYIEKVLEKESTLPQHFWHKVFYGCTSFHQLVQNPLIDLKVVQRVLKTCHDKGVRYPDVNQTDHQGNTSLHLAGLRKDDGKILVHLLSHPQANPLLRNHKGYNPLGCCGLLSSKKKTKEAIDAFQNKGLSIHDPLQTGKPETVLESWIRESEYWDEMLEFLEQLRTLYPPPSSLTRPKMK